MACQKVREQGRDDSMKATIFLLLAILAEQYYVNNIFVVGYTC